MMLATSDTKALNSKARVPSRVASASKAIAASWFCGIGEEDRQCTLCCRTTPGTILTMH